MTIAFSINWWQWVFGVSVGCFREHEDCTTITIDVLVLQTTIEIYD